MSELEEINNYKELISSYVKRIISNHIEFKPVKIDETCFDLKLLFTKPEWFLELDDDLQYNIENNVKLYLKENYDTIKNIAVEMMKQ
tara:strand:+ start:252 stop:512 length:261 start_codon:yes stop_codon:yes gene_type:complete